MYAVYMQQVHIPQMLVDQMEDHSYEDNHDTLALHMVLCSCFYSHHHHHHGNPHEVCDVQLAVVSLLLPLQMLTSEGEMGVSKEKCVM